MKRLTILGVVILALTATAFAQPERIGTRQWKLVEVDGMNVPESSRAYLQLENGQRRFTGHTGCNSMFGAAAVRGRRINFLNVGTTRMACQESRVRRIETAVVRALANADRYRIRGGALELIDRGRVVMRLTAPTKRDPQPIESALDERRWVLEAIGNRPTSRLGRTAFVVFDATKGSAGGNSSCNVFGGSYTASRNTIRITEVISTMRACVEDERMQIEREFLEGLRQANRYDIVGDRLRLYRNDRLLLTFNGEPK